jgi:hypothetical protein
MSITAQELATIILSEDVFATLNHAVDRLKELVCEHGRYKDRFCLHCSLRKINGSRRKSLQKAV